MKSRGGWLGLLLGAMIAQAAAAPAAVQAARDLPEHDDLTAVQPRPPLSPREAARRAQVQFGGRVLAVRPEGDGFRVKLLKNGEVRSVHIVP